MDRHTHNKAATLHEDLDYIGLRAQATSAGLVQLCSELVDAGVLDDAAIGRIKDAVRCDILVSRRRVHDRAEFEDVLKRRLDSIFPSPNEPRRPLRVGTVADMQSALSTHPDELGPGN